MEPLHEVNQNSCDFCAEIHGSKPLLPQINFPSLRSRLYLQRETDGFFLLADASPITSPHILIIPNSHFEKYSLLDCSKLDKFISIIANSIEDNETAIFFEHGGYSCLRNGLCSEHAHLHIVISDGVKCREILDKIVTDGGRISKQYKSFRILIENEVEPKNKDYLIFGYATKKNVFVHEIFFDKIESQVLRNYVSSAMGKRPHITDIFTRQNAFLSTCKWLSERFTAYYPDIASQFNTIKSDITQHRLQSKEHCHGCTHDCPRAIKV